MAGYISRRFTCPRAVTHPSSNRAQCRLTALIELNALTTTLHRHPWLVDWASCCFSKTKHGVMSVEGR